MRVRVPLGCEDKGLCIYGLRAKVNRHEQTFLLYRRPVITFMQNLARIRFADSALNSGAPGVVSITASLHQRGFVGEATIF